MLRQVYLMAPKAWQALCFRDIRRKRGSPVRGSVQASFRGTFRSAFWKLFGVFLTIWGALGLPLGDFWWTFVALGGAFETFVGFWACLVALGRICEVFGAFLKRFSTFLNNFNVFSMIFLFFLYLSSQCWAMLANAVAWVGVGRCGERGPCTCFAKLLSCPSWFLHLLVSF